MTLRCRTAAGLIGFASSWANCELGFGQHTADENLTRDMVRSENPVAENPGGGSSWANCSLDIRQHTASEKFAPDAIAAENPTALEAQPEGAFAHPADRCKGNYENLGNKTGSQQKLSSSAEPPLEQGTLGFLGRACSRNPLPNMPCDCLLETNRGAMLRRQDVVSFKYRSCARLCFMIRIA